MCIIARVPVHILYQLALARIYAATTENEAASWVKINFHCNYRSVQLSFRIPHGNTKLVQLAASHSDVEFYFGHHPWLVFISILTVLTEYWSNSHRLGVLWNTNHPSRPILTTIFCVCVVYCFLFSFFFYLVLIRQTLFASRGYVLLFIVVILWLL